jgi:hypothetical protein
MKRRREISCAGLQMQSPHLQRLSQGSTENASIAAKEVLFAKVIEQRARAAEVQRHLKPDLTVALFSKSPNFVQRDIGSFELSIESFDARQMFFRKCFFSP